MAENMQHRDHNHGDDVLDKGSQLSLAHSATLHCLLGCGIGEVVGIIIGTALSLSNLITIVLALVLGFVFGSLLRLNAPAFLLSSGSIALPQCHAISPRARSALVQVSSAVSAQVGYRRMVPAESETTMRIYQMPVQSLSATLPAAIYPKAQLSPSN